MPLPLILGIGAALAGTVGVGGGIRGAVKMKEANDTMKSSERLHEENIAKFEARSKEATSRMDELGKLELEIMNGFEDFSNVMEKIQNRPKFEENDIEGANLPKYDAEELKKVSVGAGVLLGGLGGAAVGTAGGFAAAGAATSAVMALGTASTGTAIASLSGVAATNATLAALGGGALAAGGGGMALGTTILGAATLGVGLLVGGMIFNITGSKLGNKADDAYKEVRKEKEIINKICEYLDDLSMVSWQYTRALEKVKRKYLEVFGIMSYVVNTLHKTDWNEFSEEEKQVTQNAVLLVGLLFKMCQVKLVNKSENEEDMNEVNRKDINNALKQASDVMQKVA